MISLIIMNLIAPMAFKPEVLALTWRLGFKAFRPRYRSARPSAATVAIIRRVSNAVLQAFLAKRGVFKFLAFYGFVLITLVIAEISLRSTSHFSFPRGPAPLNIAPLLKDATSYFLGAQVTMIGLLFPIAIALVTLIVQREDASSTVSDVQVYYHQTLAYQIGASGIALSIVLAVQLLWRNGGVPLGRIERLVIKGCFKPLPFRLYIWSDDQRTSKYPLWQLSYREPLS
jgi:hypothetical protein